MAYKILCGFIALTFSSSVILPPTPVFAQTVLNLPVPGMMVAPSPGFMPVQMTGLTIHPDNPLRFDFIMDTGHSGLDIHSEEFKKESAKLIKYFMASLTTPEEELWVNLSPYEKDRMIPADLGKTEMGRDMLAQDYLLKQLTASLMYPEQELGKEFWKRVYQKARERFGTTEIPLNTFNKIWIVPEDALVYEQNGSAFVIHSQLAVMLEEDYAALRQSKNTAELAPEDTVVSGLQSQVVREVLIPEITKEINEGKNFANLRQIFNALILATWYKVRLKESLLGKVYVNQGKTKGIDVQDKEINEKIYTQYLEAFKKGVYNYIREDYDEATQQVIPRKYFSGGVSAARMRNGKWFSQFLLTGGLVLGLTAFSALPSSAREEGKNVLAGVGNQAGVTAEFVENSPNDVTVTVHNGKNVRPLLLAQASGMDSWDETIRPIKRQHDNTVVYYKGDEVTHVQAWNNPDNFIENKPDRGEVRAETTEIAETIETSGDEGEVSPERARAYGEAYRKAYDEALAAFAMEALNNPSYILDKLKRTPVTPRERGPFEFTLSSLINGFPESAAVLFHSNFEEAVTLIVDKPGYMTSTETEILHLADYDAALAGDIVEELEASGRTEIIENMFSAFVNGWDEHELSDFISRPIIGELIERKGRDWVERYWDDAVKRKEANESMKITSADSASSPVAMRHQLIGAITALSLLWGTVVPSANALEMSLWEKYDEPTERARMVNRIALGIINLEDEQTGLAPSHLGHPGFEKLKFVYDAAVDALVLKAAGKQKEAEKILDYFADRLAIPIEKVAPYADTNGIAGILKIWKTDEFNVRGLINALDRTSTKPRGQGMLEYYSTPGPMAFIVMAFLNVNKERYLPVAVELGNALLSLQRPDGGLKDGDRSPNRVHIEPHMDSFATFLQLYQATNDKKWKTAAEQAWQFFIKSGAYHPQDGIIWQGVWEFGTNKVFATDAYSWTMAGPAGDRMSLSELEKFTETMLSKSLTSVTLELPDGKTRTVVLVDFTDPKDPPIVKEREGFHPMGSVEWAGGVIAALQKNAVRFWEKGNPQQKETARHYKALAEYLIANSLYAFYEIPGLEGLLSFYATGQNVQTGHGWRTPFFYVKGPGVTIKGGSLVSAWPVLPIQGLNPFDRQDPYKKSYDAIPISGEDKERALQFVALSVVNRSFKEAVPTKGPDAATQIVEPGNYNLQMWNAFVRGDYKKSMEWAQKVVNDPDWIRLARRDQEQKAKEIGGLVRYPWGNAPSTVSNLETAIWRYPLLNEVAAAMWGLAAANFELGNREESKKWIRRIIEEVPYHQIYAPDGPGYWNALISWEYNPGNVRRDAQMGVLYREVLREMGLRSAAPKEISIRGPQILPVAPESRDKLPITKKTPPPVSEPKPKVEIKVRENVWLRGSPGEYVSHQWQARATYAEFDPPLRLQKGQKIKISYSLTGSDVLGIQLIPVGVDENMRGDMIVKRGVGGSGKTLIIEVPDDRKVWRIALQYGKNAWGPLGGSVDAVMRIHAVEIYDEQHSGLGTGTETPASSPVGDYYEVLGVARDAAPEEIKTAYRELAKKLHPDINMQIHPQMRKSLEEQFKEINLAYEILSDVEKRGDYDFILNDGTDHSNLAGQQGTAFDIASRPSNDLRGKDMFERARRVERMREPEYIPILVDAFNNDTDLMVRESAAKSLAHIGTREALFALTKLDIHSGSVLVFFMVNHLYSSASERKNYLAVHSLADYAAKNSAVLLSIIKNKSHDAKNALTKSTDLNPRRARHIYETIKGILTHLGQTEDVGPWGIKKNNPEVVRITRQVLKRSLFNSDGSVNELIAEVLKVLEPEDYDDILGYYRQRLKNPADGVIQLRDAANLKRLTEPGKGGVSSSPVVEQEGQGAGVREQGVASDEIQDTNAAPGGIDLNPALLDLQIKRDGNGVPLPLPMQPIENMHIDGFLPVIINIVPITNLSFLLGLDLPPGGRGAGAVDLPGIEFCRDSRQRAISSRRPCCLALRNIRGRDSAPQTEIHGTPRARAGSFQLELTRFRK